MQNQSNKSIESLYDEATASVAAETLLSAMGPQIERRLEVLINKFVNSPPELAPLLQSQAQIGELWRIRRALKEQASRGKEAVTMFESFLKGD